MVRLRWQPRHMPARDSGLGRDADPGALGDAETTSAAPMAAAGRRSITLSKRAIACAQRPDRGFE